VINLYNNSKRYRIAAKLWLYDKYNNVVVIWQVTAVFSDFLGGAANISIKQLLSCIDDDEWTPFQNHYFSENVVAPGTPGSVARNSEH
jgi:hypothetical protein